MISVKELNKVANNYEMQKLKKVVERAWYEKVGNHCYNDFESCVLPYLTTLFLVVYLFFISAVFTRS